MLTYLVQEHEEGLLRDFLHLHKQISRKSVSQIKHGGFLRVNGENATVRYLLKSGDKVEIGYPEEQSSPYVLPEKIPLDIIYEDEDILLVNKRAGECVHPTFTQTSGTLANGVMYHYQQKGIKQAFHPVNRLDKDTSGLVLIAQHKFSHQQLFLQQQNKQLERYYYAWVAGSVEPDFDFIEEPIDRVPDSIIKRAVLSGGKYAKTNYEVLQRYKDYTWLRVKLETGRTHQIRVHFSHIGHPLLGDDLYGGKRELISRQALHAYGTLFFHPRTGKELSFEAPLPEDLQQLT